jgi:hypothetical protein
VDFVSTASSPASSPYAVICTNAMLEQWLISCPLERRAFFPAVLNFSLRRSSTFAARCVIEASTDGGLTFGVTLGEAPATFSASTYELLEFPLPAALAGTDSFRLRWHIIPAATGTTATLRLDDVRLTRLRTPVLRGTVVINEIQPQPPAGQGEWIELYNAGNEPVDVAGWRVRDSPSGTAHALSAAVQPLLPGALFVLASDSASVRPAAGAGAVILQPDGFPSLNNAGDLVLVEDERGATMDSVRYDEAWTGESGVSIERVDPFGRSTSHGNWGSCEAPARSTPGAENSIVIRPYDLRMGRVTLERDPLSGGLVFRMTVQNAGSAASQPCGVEVFAEAPVAGEMLLASCEIRAPIAAADSAVIVCAWTDARPGRIRVRAVVVWPSDQRPGNNAASADVLVPLASGVLRINEIQAGPTDGTSEFIEIINVGAVPVSLDGCFIADRRIGASQVRLWPVTDRRRVIAAAAMHVVAGDSAVRIFAALTEDVCTTVSRSGLGLNNDGDTVLLYSADSLLIDSVAYSAAWHSATVDDPAGRSLERYHPQLASGDPRNWGSCVDPSGSTPGRANSIIVTATPSDASLVCAPDPFSPDADGRDDATVVRFRLPVRSSLIRIRIYDIRGRCVRELVNAAPAGMTGEVVWDGMSDGRMPLRIGIYIVHLEGIDDAGGRVLKATCGVVLARQL